MISIVEHNADVRIDHSLGTEAITALSGRRSPARSAGRWRVSGLTSAEFEVAYEIGVTLQRVRRGVVCVWLRKLDLRLGYASTTIYLDRWYRRGSCAYGAVVDDALAPHLARFEAARERQHAELDSPASYAQLQDRCRDW